MADGVDTRMQSMKASVSEAMPDRLVPEAQLFQLLPFHHPVLPTGKFSHPRVRVCFASLSQQAYRGVWDRLVLHALSLPGYGARVAHALRKM